MYARALYQAARDQGALEEVREQLEGLAGALEAVPALRRVLGDREIDTAAKIEVLGDVLAGGNQLVANFAALMAEKGRASEITEAIGEFERLLSAQERVLSVDVSTAHALSDADFDKLLKDIERKSGRKVEATRRVEPDLIGGIVVQAGSLRLDASVRGQFERLRQELGVAR